MNFHASKDLGWKITGFRLDALEQEWVKRLPPDESEGEVEQQQEGADGGGDGDEDGDVEMGGAAGSDIDKDTDDVHVDAQQLSADQPREASLASSGPNDIQSGPLLDFKSSLAR